MPAIDRTNWEGVGYADSFAAGKMGRQARRKTVLFHTFYGAAGKATVWRTERRCVARLDLAGGGNTLQTIADEAEVFLLPDEFQVVEKAFFIRQEYCWRGGGCDCIATTNHIRRKAIQ